MWVENGAVECKRKRLDAIQFVDIKFLPDRYSSTENGTILAEKNIGTTELQTPIDQHEELPSV
jgi:hypothetical protein